jgi:hypothetical protein
VSLTSARFSESFGIQGSGRDAAFASVGAADGINAVEERRKLRRVVCMIAS